jgi:hypothetical protein
VGGKTLTWLVIGANADDITWATSATGAVFLTDNATNLLFQIKGTFAPGTASVDAASVDTASESGVPDTLSMLNLSRGQVTPVVIGPTIPTGLRFVDRHAPEAATVVSCGE